MTPPSVNDGDGGIGGWILVALVGGAAAGIAGFLLGTNSERARNEQAERENPAVLRRNDVAYFDGPVECDERSRTEIENHYSCGQRAVPGKWTTPTSYPDSESARTDLALPPENCADTVVRVVTAPGTVRCRGRVAAAFGQPGGGIQTLTYETNREWFS
jgi:hypothetical protein